MTEPICVLHIIRPEPAGSVGGADLHVIDLCAAQNRLGTSTAEILALDASHDFLHRAHRAGVTVYDPFGNAKRRWRHLTALPAKQGVDLIHAHGYEADYLAAVMPLINHQWRHLPCVMTCHGIIDASFRTIVMSRIDLYCMRRARALIAVSEHGASRIRRALRGTPVYVIPNGVDLPQEEPDSSGVRSVRAELGVTDSELLVGYVGRLFTEKRPDLFLAAAADLAAHYPTMKFAVVGGGPLQQHLVRTARASDAADRITLTGLRHDMDRVFSALDILVIPSDIEGTPRVALEAQAYGVPVVATSVGDLPKLVHHEVTGLLVPPGQPDRIIHAVMQLADDPRLRQRIAQQAQRRVQSASIVAMVEAVHAVYLDAARDLEQPGEATRPGSQRL